jgi:hypothetical protein
MPHDECCVCMSSPVATRLEPCFHEIMCALCASAVLAGNFGCPFCRQPIRAIAVDSQFGVHGNIDNEAKRHTELLRSLSVRLSDYSLARDMLPFRDWDPRFSHPNRALGTLQPPPPPPFFHANTACSKTRRLLEQPGDFLVVLLGNGCRCTLAFAHLHICVCILLLASNASFC